jgi:hypothetical protein
MEHGNQRLINEYLLLYLNKLKTMSQYKTYDEFKQGVKDNYPIRKVVNLSDVKIDLDDDQSNFGMINLEGHNLKLSRKAFQGLIKTLGLSNNFINKFANIFGAKAKSQLVNIIKGVISDHKLDVSNMSITPEGDLKISTLNRSTGWGLEIPELKDESFHCGVIVTAGPTEEVAIDPHILRLVCTNGMVGPRRLEMGPRLESNNVSDIQKFMLETKRLQESNKQFKTIFTDQVRKMNSIQASYEEMFKMRESVKKHVADITDSRTEAVLDKYFPLMEVRKKYFDEKNIALGNLTHRHWKNAKTHMTTWELLNSLTDVASHDYGMGISDYKKEVLKKEAGMYMFKKEFDTEFIL